MQQRACSYSTTTTTEILAPLAAPIIQCGTTTTNSAEFIWNDVGASQYEITVSSPTNGTNTTIVNGTNFTEMGLPTGETVTATVIALGNAPCGNSPASNTASCSAEDCPTITPSIDNVAAEYCTSDAVFALTGSPAGGTFSGTSGVNNGQFDPAAATPGTVTITYDYTDPTSGCIYQTTFNTEGECAARCARYFVRYNNDDFRGIYMDRQCCGI